MLGIVGTLPDLDLPLIHGPVQWLDGQLCVADRRIPVNRGTAALLAAALNTAVLLNGPKIYAFLAGDIGRGQGSRELYAFLTRHLPAYELQALTFHYLQPDVDWHNKVLFAVAAMPRRPILIADAGFMYAAKMSGQAKEYDFFTPDVGELAFLADEQAPHPFYTRGFILHHNEEAIPDLIHRAYLHDNAAAYLLVKGKTDYIVHGGKVVATVAQPSFPALEAIGGTGDSVTGLLTSLCGAGFDLTEAATLAAKANRLCGVYVQPTPATQVLELIDKIPHALSSLLSSAGSLS